VPRAHTRAVGSSPSVLIISAAMGAGHDGVAFELERRLHARGAEARVVDYLDLLPGRMGPFYRAFYHGQLKYAPSSYEWLYGKMDRGVIAPVAAWLGQRGQRRVRRLARHHDVVVSTYPLGCQATGALRQKGKLKIPAVGFLTDVDVHGLWLHPGIDLNMTVWQGSAVEAINRVGSPSQAVGPVLPAAFVSPSTTAERAEGRALMGLGPEATAVLVVAGSWGVGDIGRTARAIRDAGAGTPVVLCGRNETLREELDAEDGIVAIGWTSEVRRLLAAADVLVHNAGGLSCLEGFAVGVPVIGHACLPGHGHRNAEAMRDAEVAAYAESTEDLVREIRRLARTPEGAAMVARAKALFRTDPTDQLLEMAVQPVPVPRVQLSAVATWSRRVTAVGIGVPATLGMLTFGVAQATTLGHLGVAEGSGGVYVAALVDHTQVLDPRIVAALREQGVSAAVTDGLTAPTPTDLRALAAAGVTVVGADAQLRTRNPKHTAEAIESAARAVATMGDAKPKVVCLKIPGMVQRMVAWEDKVQLAHPDEVLLPGQQARAPRDGQQVVLDERGRSTAQVLADLAGFARTTRTAGVAQVPMRALWPTV
jgi:processive 1,2-diacylglycerol beta-glucosyltransferase